MTDEEQAAKTDPARMWKMLCALLAIHFCVVHLFPDYMFGDRIRANMFQGPSAVNPAKRVMDRDGRKFLWGGEQEHQHFDITEFRLEPESLNYGLGREAFAALLEPQFDSVKSTTAPLHDKAEVLLVKVGDDARVYPVEQLIRHEVVNDVVGGRPIFASYCILARLGCVYDRRINNHTFTFGVSGYTYAVQDVWHGNDAFVLWDRDTESLWWPPIGKAVSGPAIDTAMKVLEPELWAQTTWDAVVRDHPDAKVLRLNQPHAPPVDFPRLPQMPQSVSPEPFDPARAISPQWGQNTKLGP